MPIYRPTTARTGSPAVKAVASVLGLATLALAAQPAMATTIVDPTGDILPTFSGPHTGAASGPFDVISASAIQDGSAVKLSVTLNGPATATTYIFGVNRGAGTAIFQTLSPPVGAGVTFDAVAVLLPGGGSLVQLLPSMAVTPLSEVSFSGNTVTAIIPLGDFPSTGFTPANFLYNVWPRNGLNPLDNTQISDFAPDASDFAASAVAAVPEPSAWALMLLGIGAVGAALRGRRRLASSPAAMAT